MNNFKVDCLYKKVLNKRSFKESDLWDLGFSSREIEELLNKSILEKNDDHDYKFIYVDGLFDYYLMLKNVDEERAKQYLKICQEIDYKNDKLNFYFFYNDVLEENYEEAFTYLERILETSNPYHKQDYNYYLFLFSMIIELPSKYAKMVSDFKPSDIKIKPRDVRYTDLGLQNRLREEVLSFKFKESIDKLKIMVRRDPKNMYNVVVLNLINAATKENFKRRKDLLSLALKKDYHGCLELLDSQKERFDLREYEMLSYKLLKSIISIVDDGIYPPISLKYASSLEEAINSNNFPLALDMSNRCLKKSNIFPKNNTLNVLLRDINDLYVKREMPEFGEEEFNNKINEIINNLRNKDMDSVEKDVHNYLKSIGKEQYVHFTLDLLKLALLNNDFSEFRKQYRAMSNLNYHIDVREYLKRFHIAALEGDLERQEIYHDILDISKDNDMISDYIVDGLPSRRVMVRDKDKLIKEIGELYNTGVLVFDEKDTSNRELLGYVDQNMKDVMYYKKDSYLVVKCRELIPYTNTTPLNDAAQFNYENKKYQKALSQYRILLEHYDNPHQYIFNAIGKIYGRLGDVDTRDKFNKLSSKRIVYEKK